MIQIICGEKGKGKTKEMLNKANDVVNQATGDVIYVDKSSKHMYELNNKIRLINICDYPVKTYDGFIGFVSGLLSGNHDIETVLIDSLLKISDCEDDAVSTLIETLEKLSENCTFILSVSRAKDQLPENLKDKVIIAC